MGLNEKIIRFIHYHWTDGFQTDGQNILRRILGDPFEKCSRCETAAIFGPNSRNVKIHRAFLDLRVGLYWTKIYFVYQSSSDEVKAFGELGSPVSGIWQGEWQAYYGEPEQ